MSSADLWRRAQRVFEAVVDDDTADRGGRVRDLCEGDGELESCVLELLAADGQQVHMPEEAPLSDLEEILDPNSNRERWVGRRLGPYEVVRELGRGGMGTVFLAERRDEEYEMQVAIKLVRFELAGEAGLDRFRVERQLLAGLEHPNIARLLDGGTTEEGIPYLVMEYVDGAPIVEYCDQKQLAVEDRLTLFREVCAAVQHAHRNLVVHRDLKASNILVTGEGVPKLLDFGIAKLLDRSGVDTTQTATLSRRLTPEYASPEQILGGSITTASDVYSLGVLLYELLAGRRPHDFSQSGLTELARRVEREAPARPSETTLEEEAAQSRGNSVDRLRKRLSGDLDNIVLRALEKDPARRYGSAEALSDELDRHLSGLPVLARPATIAYRLSRFCRRNAVAVAASSIGVALLIGALLLALVQRNVARRETARAEEISDFLLDAFANVDPDVARGRQVTVREVLDDSAMRLDRELADQPDLRASMMLEIGKIYRILSLYDDAEPLLSGALAHREATAGESDLRTADALDALARLMLDTGAPEDALDPASRALEIRHAADRAEAAESLHLLAQIYWSQDDRERAIQLHREGLAWAAEHVGMDSESYIDGLNLLGIALRSRGAYRDAQAAFEEAFNRQEQRIQGAHPAAAEILSELAKLYEARDDVPVARDYALRALEMNRRLYGEAHPSIVANLNTLGNIEQDLGDVAAALGHYRESLGMQREILGEQHPRIPSLLYNVATLVHREMDRPGEAIEEYAEAVSMAHETLGPNHTNLGFFLIGYGDCLTDLGRANDALAPLTEAQTLFRSKSSVRNIALAESALGGAYLALGRNDRARELIESSHPTLAESFAADHRIVVRSAERLAAVRRLARS